jgi:hypothetical protein
LEHIDSGSGHRPKRYGVLFAAQDQHVTSATSPVMNGGQYVRAVAITLELEQPESAATELDHQYIEFAGVNHHIRSPHI